MVLLALFYLLVPAAVIQLCRKVPFFGRIGPVLVLYALGIVVGNLPLMPGSAYKLQEILSSAMIPLAIPMLLFNSDFARFSWRSLLTTLMCGVVGVVVAVIAGFLIFREGLGPEGYKIGGMLTGVYTGGTPNLAALKLMLGVREETYILLNSYDMIVSFLYMVFLMSVGIRMFRRFLPATAATGSGAGASGHEAYLEEDPYRGIFQKKYLVSIAKALGLSLVIFGISAGAAMLVDEKYFMVVIILSLTTLGIAASFVRPVRRLEKSYDAGMYLVYVFSVVVASMANLSNLDLRNGIYLLVYIVFAIFVSLTIQTLLSKLFRVDADTMVISSVALINSAPFVPMMAATMKNKDVILPGLSVGIIGYAVGNYLGFVISEFLRII